MIVCTVGAGSWASVLENLWGSVKVSSEALRLKRPLSSRRTQTPDGRFCGVPCGGGGGAVTFYKLL